ncbi:nucleosome assembly protein 1-like 1 isoform X1 [Dendronephthya gigantea]|uniref:nucleosome assembly protein 1-like 1 isoform X1 n=1 Tax=Dendronephthya gigantea TaxID=151771 RepID=UPI0010694D93|nr:nucleosome assembly protein 1-like 1 isoform X1 [Dendronephthya gigantea]
MGDNIDSAEGSSPPKQESIVANMMQNPQVLAALQEQLGRVVGTSSGYIESLPKAVQRRIKALKNIQVSCMKLEAEFYRDVHALECKYAEKSKQLYEQRDSVINGDYEPTDEECEWASDDEDEEDGGDNEQKLSQNELKDKATLDENKVDTETLPENVRGIPEFWLTAMKNVDHIADMIQEHDEPILKNLTSIDLKFIDEEKTSQESGEGEKEVTMGFVLEFHFAPNAYFNNSVLTKTYKLSCEIDKEAPFGFEGPEITHTTGCTIDWKKGKNVTVKVIKKKQKHKGKGQGKYVNKTVKADSFFNFFTPPEVQEEEMDEETEQLLEADFEIGHFFRENLIPKAVLFFTGEAMDDEFDEEEEEDEDDDDDENQGEDDEDDDPDFKPPEENPPECKQQ